MDTSSSLERGRQVDVHPVTFDARGGGVYQMEDGEWIYPAEGFAGRGTVEGRVVRCLGPQAQVLVHAGFELAEKDFLELYLLRERFGVELPEELLDRVEQARRNVEPSSRERRTATRPSGAPS
ncbi:MAG TPA: hypothetical protein VI503_04450 [Gaiellaceae bacterium]|nr:hypothetical protein [Gaiellaceae bacterium]